MSETCGVGIPTGGQAGLPLPYRGQAQAVMPSAEELEGVPEGPARAVLLRSRMTRGVCSPHAPMPHAGLGLPGYVQVCWGCATIAALACKGLQRA